MRARDFLIEFQAPGVSADTGTVYDDIMLLLNLNPKPATLQKIDKILSKAAVDKAEPSKPDLGKSIPAAKPGKTSANQTAPTAAEPADKRSNKPVAPNQAVGTSELDEAVPKQSLIQKIEALERDRDNPQSSKLLSMIEAVLEHERLEELTTKLVEKKFKDNVEQIISSLLSLIMNARVPIASKLAFFPKANAGIVDYAEFFKINRIGNAESQTSLYDTLKSDPLLNAIGKRIGQLEFGVGGNKLGKMEILMILIGKGVTKQGSGDLHLNDGTDLEIKTSGPTIDKKGKKSTSGAPLYALGKDKKTGESVYGANTGALKDWQKDAGRILGIDPKAVPHSLNASVIDKLNSMTVGQNKKRQALLKAIKNIFKHVFKHADDLSLDVIDSCIGKNGIDGNALVKAARQIEFDYYKKAIGHSAVLFINTSTGNYYYIESGEELMQHMRSGQNQVSGSRKGPKNPFYSTGIIDMKGTYANGLSKVFTA